MRVLEGLVAMGVAMGFGHRLGVVVTMMRVMHMPMLVLEGLVHMGMRVPRAHHKEHPAGHEEPGQCVDRGWPVAQERHGEERPRERRGGEDGGLPCGAEGT